MKVWVKYLLRQICATFCLFFFGLFCVYTIVDLSIHGVRFFSKNAAPWQTLCLYYGCDFLTQLHFFLPLTFLLSLLKILLDLNTHHELVALQMAGLSRRRILLPFFWVGCLLVGISYANYEWISPLSQTVTHQFETTYTSKTKKEKRPNLYNTKLPDGSELVYREFSLATETLHDVFWIESQTTFWHFKNLQIGAPPQGTFVDHFVRNSEGKVEKAESFLHKEFPKLTFNLTDSLQHYLPVEQRRLSALWDPSLWLRSGPAASQMHYKLAIPWLPLWILFAIGPLTFTFRRNKQAFLIVALCLFSFVSLMTFLEAMMILGENQVIPAILAIWGPFVMLSILRALFKMRASSL
jgi:lipopolysaccharide export LptBFGC system permease protein LptF